MMLHTHNVCHISPIMLQSTPSAVDITINIISSGKKTTASFLLHYYAPLTWTNQKFVTKHTYENSLD